MRTQKTHCISGIALTLLVIIISACAPADDPNAEVQAANAEAGPIQNKTVGDTIELNASESTGTGIRYHWTLRAVPTGSTLSLSEFESINPSFTAVTPGTYVVQLIVSDSASGTSKDFAVVNVAAVEDSNQGLIDHTGFKQECQECHNGILARGRSASHIEATVQCEVCHSTLAWTPNIAVDHNELIGVCTNCHNDIRALGKPVNHIETSAECNQCHNAGTTFSIAIAPGAPIETGVIGTLDDGDEEVDGDHPPIGELMCVDCHNNVIEEGKEDDHILTTDMCEACHNTNDWEPVVTVDHTQVIGECSSCHNKPLGHIETTSECNICHGTTAWTPTISGGGGGGGTVDHSNFTAATVCMDCHNGTIATGKPLGHVVTASDCDTCHTTVTWVRNPAGTVGTVDHSNFTQATVCMNCHNGTNATGKPLTHIVTTDDCDVCHTTMSFGGGLLVDHTNFTIETVCMDCHNGTIAIGKNSGHVFTLSDCDDCHNTTTFD